MKLNRVWRTLFSALLASIGCVASAAPVTVPDFSFELTATGPGGRTGGSAVGTNWSASGNGGVYLQSLTNTLFTATSSNTLPATADGTNYLDLDVNGHSGYCWQDIGTLEPNTRYTLTIALGQSLLGNVGSGFIALVNGTTPFQTILASTPVDNSLLTPGTFSDVTLTYTTGYQAGGPLTILMEGTNGSELLFDNVRLDATPTPNAPTALAPSSSSPSGVVYVGTPVTLGENPAGSSPFTYQWQTDNGSGGASFAAIAGATASNYVANTSGFTAGSFEEYRVVVSNSFGASTSAPVTLSIVQGQPVIVQQTLPSSGSDVVGSSVTFTAAFDGSRPLNYQWLVDYGSGPQPIAGANSATFTLSNMQIADSGSYSLQASNSFGAVASAPSAFTVNTVPTDVDGIVASPANQLGLGGPTIFTPTWVLPTNSLIAGELPASSSGNFRLEGSGGVGPLTDGRFGALYPEGNASPDVATGGISSDNAGTSLIYNLPHSQYGYDISNVVVYGGWSDAGRDQQEYTLLYSTFAASNAFNPITFVSYLPDDPNALQSATRVTITGTNGLLVKNAVALEFNFNLLNPAPENGYEGYAEIDVFGKPSQPSVVVTTNTLPVTGSDEVGGQVTLIAGFSSTEPLTYQWQMDNGSGATPVPGATSPTLTLNNLQLSDTGSYSCVASNSLGSAVSTPNSFVVNPANGPDGAGVIEAPANQTGYAGTEFTPTWVIAPGSLIAHALPSEVTGGNSSFADEGSGGIPVLTDGVFGFVGDAVNTTLATCGGNAGQTLIYQLGGAEGGYNISNVVLYGGWSDSGRDEQAYTISYSTVQSPMVFNTLTAYDFLPAVPTGVPTTSRVSYTAGSGGPLATNVAAIEIDFTTPNGGGENGYEGYAEIDVYGGAAGSVAVPPALVTDIVPAEGSDVVGSQVTFTAAFNSSLPLSYQWQKDGANIAGANGPSLTLSDLQSSDSGSYNVVASNSLGMTTSSTNSFTVNPAPSPTNGILISKANQASAGAQLAPTWTLAPGSLIAGLAPSSVGTGSFSNEGGGGVGVLTDGSLGYEGAGNHSLATAGNGGGTSVTYTLSGSSGGYNLSSIVTYGGWGDAGRDQQAYTVSYATASSPTNFAALASVSYLPTIPGAVPNATRVTVTPSGSAFLAQDVAAVKFDFTTPPGENGWEGYSELAIYGTPSSTTPPLKITSPVISNGSLVLAGTGGTPGASYTWLTSTNVGAPLSEWTTNSVGVFNSSGAFSNNVPVGNEGGRFFILRTP